MADRYLRASGNWNGAVWAATSSGAAGSAAAPTASDDVYIAANFTVTLTSNSYCGRLEQSTGTINVNGFILDIAAYITSTTSTKTINITNSTISLTRQVAPYASGFLHLNGTLNITGASTGTLYIDLTNISSYTDITFISALPHIYITSAGNTNKSVFIWAMNNTAIAESIFVNKSSGTGEISLFPSPVYNSDSFIYTRKLVAYGSANKIRLGSTSTSSYNRYFCIVGSNQITAIDNVIVSNVSAQGNGKYYVGSNSTNSTGSNTGWIFSDAPKLSTAVDAFAGQSINTTKWTNGIYISQNNGWIGTNSFGSTRSGDLKYREQFDAEGSHLKFKQMVGAGSTIKAYFANAQEQYGVTARRNIPDIYAEITDSTVKLILKAQTTYTSSSLTNNKLFYKIREQAGTIYLDGSDNGIEYTNLASVVAADYGLDSTQLTGMPLFSFTSTGVSYASIGEMNTELEPTAGFISDVVSGDNPLPVQFTDQSNFSPTSWSWNFGDSTTSTVQNPLKTYALPGTYTVTLTASKTGTSRTVTKTNYITVTPKVVTGTISGQLKLTGGIATQKAYALGAAGGSIMLTGSVRGVVIQDASRIEKKTYLYKVYDPDGNYIETWGDDVIDEPQFTEEINSLGSSMTIHLARNSDSVGQIVSPLQTEAGQNITAEDGAVLYATTESRNQVGSGSSVDYNNRVDIYVFYGYTEPLMTESGEIIYTEDGEPILVAMGAPNGRRIFTGFISGLNSRYGDTETTVVQLSSYGWDLGQFPIMNGANTTVSYLSQDPSFIAKDLTDKFVSQSSGYGTYTKREEGSISNTGTTVSYTFRANTYAEGLSKTVELMPSNWYYRVGLGDNTVYFKERSSTPQHLFLLSKHIKSLELAGSILDSVNDVLFTGGGDPALYIRRSEAPASRTRRRLVNLSDNRVTVLESAEIIAENQIGNANKQLYRTTVTILSEVYDIESINIGDVVGFRNFDNYVDGLTMQIVGRSYTPDAVTLQLESMPLSVNKRLEDLRRNLAVTENENAPNSPS